MRDLKGLILLNAYAPSLRTHQAVRFVREFERRGVKADVKRNDFFPAQILHGNVDARFDYDFCLYLDKDKYVSQMLEAHGIKLFNSAKAVADCDDKMQTHIALSGLGIPMPQTLPGLLCYDKTAKPHPSVLDRIEQALGYPVIIKQSYGSLGKGVFKADDRAALERIADEVKLTSHLFQRYIAQSHGKDMRVIVVGGHAVGGMLRMSDGDFRSNIGLGAHAEKTTVPAEIKEIAERAAIALGLDYCGIDFLLGKQPLLCEVNSNAFFEAFEQTTGIDVAGLYADHILQTVSKKRTRA